MADGELSIYPFEFSLQGETPKKRGKDDFGARKQLRNINSLLKRQDIQTVITVCDFELSLLLYMYNYT